MSEVLHDLIDEVADLGRFTEDKRAALHAKAGERPDQKPAAGSGGSLFPPVS